MSAPGSTKPRLKIHQLALLLHIQKTTRLLSAVIADERVPVWRKLSFVGILAALMVALFVPEAAADIGTALIPILNFFGIPVEILGEAGLDWTVLAMAAFNLLKIFPSDIVGEHYDRLFRK